MLAIIEKFLSQNMSPEFTDARMTTVRLIESQGLISPTETIVEAINYKDTASQDEIVLFIDEILDNFLTDILSNYYIMLKGDVDYKTKFLQALNLLDDYIDSDAIIERYDIDLPPDQALVTLMAFVGEMPVEYYEEFLVDVRPQLLEKLLFKHENLVNDEVDDEVTEDHINRVKEVKTFKGAHGDTFVTDAIIAGTIKVGTPLRVLVNLFKADISKLNSATEVSRNVYALVLSSDVANENINELAMDVASDIYTPSIDGISIASAMSEYTVRR